MPPSSPTKTSSSSGSRPALRVDRGPGEGPGPAGDALIELRDVSLRFVSYHDKQYSIKRAALDLLLRRENAPAASDFWALKDVSLRVGHGERIGVIGQNGAGK